MGRLSFYVDLGQNNVIQVRVLEDAQAGQISAGTIEPGDQCVLAGRRVCIQGKQKRTVAEVDMLDALYEETLAFAQRVERGEAELSSRPVVIAPDE